MSEVYPRDKTTFKTKEDPTSSNSSKRLSISQSMFGDYNSAIARLCFVGAWMSATIRPAIWPYIRVAMKVAIVPALVLTWLSEPICSGHPAIPQAELPQYNAMTPSEQERYWEVRWAKHEQMLGVERVERLLLCFAVSVTACVAYKLTFSFDELFGREQRAAEGSNS